MFDQTRLQLQIKSVQLSSKCLNRYRCKIQIQFTTKWNSSPDLVYPQASQQNSSKGIKKKVCWWSFRLTESTRSFLWEDWKPMWAHHNHLKSFARSLIRSYCNSAMWFWWRKILLSSSPDWGISRAVLVKMVKVAWLVGAWWANIC